MNHHQHICQKRVLSCQNLFAGPMLSNQNLYLMHSANLLSYALNQSKFYCTNGQDTDILLEDDVQHSQVILLFLKKDKLYYRYLPHWYDVWYRPQNQYWYYLKSHRSIELYWLYSGFSTVLVLTRKIIKSIIKHVSWINSLTHWEYIKA